MVLTEDTQAAIDARFHEKHEQLACLIVRMGRASGITARQIARYDSRSIFAMFSRTWLWGMVHAGYGRIVRIPSGAFGGRPSIVFVLHPQVAARIAAEVEVKSPANPTKPTGGTKRGRCAQGTSFSHALTGGTAHG